MSFDFRKSLLMLALLTALSACSDAPQTTAPAKPDAAARVVAPTADAPIVDSTPELMRRANQAFRDDRIVDPAGDNATELFLAVRERDPAYPGLSEALVEIMPLANFAFDSAIRNRDAAEAARLHGLIARIDANSAITQIASSRLAGLTQSIADEQADAEAARVATNAAKRTRVADASPSPSHAVTGSTSSASAPASNATRAASSSSLASPVRPAAATPVPPPVAGTPVPATTIATTTATAIRPPQPIAKIAPDYPPQARSRKIEGFVELEFRVTVNGGTEDIRVVRSEPEGLFDRNAVRALMRWKFKPAERNGVPEAATTRTTMNFRQS